MGVKQEEAIMAFKDDLFKNLTAEQRTAIEDSVGDDFDWDLVPRSRLNKVIAQRNELRKAAGKPSASKKKSGEDDGEDDADLYTQEQVDQMLADKQKEFDDANNAAKKQKAVVDFLKEKKAKDPMILINSKLIDLDKASLGEDGKLTGLDDVVKSLATSHAYLFEDVQKGTGKDGAGSGSGKDTDAIDSQLDSLFAEFTSPSDN